MSLRKGAVLSTESIRIVGRYSKTPSAKAQLWASKMQTVGEYAYMMC